MAKAGVPRLVMERTWWREGYRCVAGVDEAGRGALFGPVVAAAVVFPMDWDVDQICGLADSKLLAPERREEIHQLIVAQAEDIGFGVVDAAVVDRAGIVPATLMAMSKALADLSVRPGMVIVDGVGPLPAGYRACAFIRADMHCASVAAASVIAKVRRDKMVCELAKEFPQYGLERNKGYGTREHQEALALYGPTPLHRRSFASVVCSPEKALLRRKGCFLAGVDESV